MILDTVFPRTSQPETKSLIENLFYLWLVLRFWPNFFEELKRKMVWLFQEMKNSPDSKMSSPGKKKKTTVTLSSPGGQGGNQAAWNSHHFKSQQQQQIIRFSNNNITNYHLCSKNVKKTNISWLSFNSLKFISWWFGRENAAWFWEYPRGSCLQSSMAAFQLHLPAGTWPRPCHSCD